MFSYFTLKYVKLNFYVFCFPFHFFFIYTNLIYTIYRKTNIQIFLKTIIDSDKNLNWLENFDQRVRRKIPMPSFVGIFRCSLSSDWTNDNIRRKLSVTYVVGLYRQNMSAEYCDAPRSSEFTFSDAWLVGNHPKIYRRHFRRLRILGKTSKFIALEFPRNFWWNSDRLFKSDETIRTTLSVGMSSGLPLSDRIPTNITVGICLFSCSVAPSSHYIWIRWQENFRLFNSEVHFLLSHKFLSSFQRFHWISLKVGWNCNF